MKKLLLTLCLVLSLLQALASSPALAEAIPDLSSITVTQQDFPSTVGIHGGIDGGEWKKCGNRKLSEVQQSWIEAGWFQVGALPTNVFCFGHSFTNPKTLGTKVVSGFIQILPSKEERDLFDKKLKLHSEQDRDRDFEWRNHEWSDFVSYQGTVNREKEFLSTGTIKAFRRGSVGVLISEAYKDDIARLMYGIGDIYDKLDERIVDTYEQIEIAKIFSDDDSETQPSQLSTFSAPIIGDSPTTETNSNFEPSNSGSESEISATSADTETSTSSESGNCDYPWQTDSAGRRCGNRAASVRAGGRLGGTN